MVQDGFIETLGKDNNIYKFKYIVHTYLHRIDNIKVTVFSAYRINELPHDPFDFQFVELPNYQVRTIAMFLDIHNYHQGKGLPEALILELKRLFPNKIITSSSNRHQVLSDEWRSDKANAVWNRLVQSGNASYNKQYDIYIVNK